MEDTSLTALKIEKIVRASPADWEPADALDDNTSVTRALTFI